MQKFLGAFALLACAALAYLLSRELTPPGGAGVVQAGHGAAAATPSAPPAPRPESTPADEQTPTGSLRIRILGATGELFRAPVLLQLNSSSPESSVSARVDGGELLLSHMPLGEWIELNVQPVAGRTGAGAWAGVGPTAEGERVEIAVCLTAPRLAAPRPVPPIEPEPEPEPPCTGALEVSIRCAGLANPGEFEAIVRSLAGEVLEEQRFGGDARLRVEDLPPGAVDLDVRHGPTRLFQVAEISIVAGELTRDPRLLELDLAAVARALDLTLRDAAGAPLGGLEVFVQHPSDGAAAIERCRADAMGRIALVVPLETRGLWVGAPGWRVTRVELTEQREVELELLPGLRVRVAPEVGFEGWERRVVRLIARLRPLSVEGGPLALFEKLALRADVVPGRGAELILPLAGGYELGWDVQLLGEEEPHPLSFGDLQRLEVVEAAAEAIQSFAVRFSAAQRGALLR